MFPLIPALILLLLNSPAAVHQLAAEGRLPAAIAAIQGRMHSGAALAGDADCLALASLVAISSDREAARALIEILSIQPLDLPQPVAIEPETAAVAVRPACPKCLGSPQDGRGTSERSRDGPFSR